MKLTPWRSGPFATKWLDKLDRHHFSRAIHGFAGGVYGFRSAIKFPGIPGAPLAMMPYNQISVHVAVGNIRQGIADLDTELSMSGRLENFTMMSR